MGVPPEYNFRIFIRISHPRAQFIRISNFPEHFSKSAGSLEMAQLIQFQFSMTMWKITVFRIDSVTFNHKLCRICIGIIRCARIFDIISRKILISKHSRSDLHPTQKYHSNVFSKIHQFCGSYLLNS